MLSICIPEQLFSSAHTAECKGLFMWPGLFTYVQWISAFALLYLLNLNMSASTGPVELVRPLWPWSDQKSCHLWSKPGNFSVQVGPIIVRLRFFSNGRTNLDLLPPLLQHTVVVFYLCNPISSRKMLIQYNTVIVYIWSKLMCVYVCDSYYARQGSKLFKNLWAFWWNFSWISCIIFFSCL